ncbi:MAG: sulfotransferase [Symploca sp. SIO2E6]|nr:sulfotransferase [Symploca sp. SIO2E6]
MMKFNRKQRIFLVGCPRSGTTLLQSLLAAHPLIHSFPESKFFDYLYPDYEPKRRRFWLASRRARAQFNKFLTEIGREELRDRLPWYAILASQYTRSFLSLLDTLTQEQGKSIWIEKSPPHLRRIEYIQKLVPNAQFIHILRNGIDVVASLYEVTHKYPKSVWGQPWSIDKCINWWMTDIQISLSYQDQPSHILVKYEELVAQPQSVLSSLCQFINVPFEETMLQEYSKVAQQVSLAREPWKASVGNQIQNANSTKFYQLFNEEQRQYILNRIAQQ